MIGGVRVRVFGEMTVNVIVLSTCQINKFLFLIYFASHFKLAICEHLLSASIPK